MNGDGTSEPHRGDQAKTAERAVVDPSPLRDSGEISDGNSDVQRIVLFSEIAGRATEVIIEYEGQRYRLRATRNGRLLLNK